MWTGVTTPPPTPTSWGWSVTTPSGTQVSPGELPVSEVELQEKGYVCYVGPASRSHRVTSVVPGLNRGCGRGGGERSSEVQVWGVTGVWEWTTVSHTEGVTSSVTDKVGVTSSTATVCGHTHSHTKK